MSEPRADDRVVVALTTVPDPETGARIGRDLVERKLAACVTRIPGAVSIYRFEGALHEYAETLLLIKTKASSADALERRIAELHPYSVPEFVVVDASAVGGPYASWLRSVVG
jgi:periplasmic divalent cation tolerance protein